MNAPEPRAHALLAPSSAHKWMACPGSLVLEEGLPDGETKFAAEGTAAHECAKWCLLEGKDAAAYIGRVAYKDWAVDEEMAGYVQDYVDRVRAIAANGHLLVEQRLPIGHVTGEDDASGTGDAVILLPDELVVIDLKYGRGVRVEAERNPQGQMYGLGALREYEMLLSTQRRFRFIVIQPRLEHYPEWDCSLDELRAFGREASNAAELTRLASRHRDRWLGAADTPYLVPGEKQCTFCRAKPACPALAAKVSRDVGADFEDLTAAAPKGQVQSLVPMDGQALANAMAAVDLIEDWCRAVRAEIERRLVAGGNDAKLVETLGYKLVQGKKGNRAWTDEAAVEQVLRKQFRLTVEEAYSMKLISPSQAEKLLKDQPKRWAALLQHITQSEGRPSVAPAGDRRLALVMTPTSDDFTDLSEPAPAPLT